MNELPREAQKGTIFHPDLGTHANAGYFYNTRELDALLAMVFPLLRESEKSERYLNARLLQVENDFSSSRSINVRRSTLSWQVAMRVSAVEIYLQDALTFLAVYDSEFMRSREVKQEWDYDLIRDASDSDNALWTFCDKWARSFVGSGGPTRWAKALERSGLGKFDAVDIPALEAMWGYRHMRIHHGGRFSREFVARHSEQAEKLWRNGLQLTDVQEWAKMADLFVSKTDEGIRGRLRAKVSEDTIKEREKAAFERSLEKFAERDAKIEAKLQTETPEQTAERIQRYTQKRDEEFALMRELFEGRKWEEEESQIEP